MSRLPISVLFAAIAGSAAAAPPTVTHLFPAGGQRGTAVEVQAFGAFERWPVQVWSSTPAIQAKAGDKGKIVLQIAPDAAPSVAWLRLHDAEGASVARPFLVGTLPEVAEKEPNDVPSTAQKIGAPRAVVNGKLDKSGDVDLFAVDLKKGTTFVAALQAKRTLGSPMDGVLQILNADGIVLAQNDDRYGYDPLIAFDPPRDGAYLVRVFAFPAAPDATVRFAGGDKYVYRLTLSDGPFVDHAFPPVASRKNPGSIERIGWNLPEALRKKAVPATNEANEALLHDGDLPQATPLPVVEEPVVVVAGSGLPTNALAIPVSACGRIAKPGAVETVWFSGKKGQKAEFRLESASLGFDLDGLLRLYDAEGKLIAETKADAIGADPKAAYVFVQDGTIRAEVRDLTRQGGMRHVFRLAALLAEPDYALKLATDRLTQKVGQPLDVDILLEPHNGFSQPIELEIVGTEAKTSTKAKDAKTLTLHVEPAKEAFAGPIRVVGKAKGLPPRPATATIADLDRTTSDLWLTIGK